MVLTPTQNSSHWALWGQAAGHPFHTAIAALWGLHPTAETWPQEQEREYQSHTQASPA